MEQSEICRYCGGVIRLVPARAVYGSAVKRLGLEKEYLYQCQNCNARVGCHKGTTRPLGHVANETLRLKRMETHQVFDAFWKHKGMSRTKGYRWLAGQMGLPLADCHFGYFDLQQLRQAYRLLSDVQGLPMRYDNRGRIFFEERRSA